MDRKELEKDVIRMVAQCYSVEESSLSTDTVFGEDITGASIQMVGLVSEIENELDVMIQLADAASCRTIGELCGKIAEEL